ncbi:hypothetical protein [Streptomyces gobitricini]|uniref:CU044_5270 family protein n=1 Tax=Streptomyces gobitricini TaxID=68211 RepID=A0ABP5YAY5_9ACTN
MDEMNLIRDFRADVPVPDRARLTPARQRLYDEIARSQRRTARWRPMAVALGSALAVTAAALLTALPVRGGETDSAGGGPRSDQWVYQQVRWDTWKCATGADLHAYSEVGSFNLGVLTRPCEAKPAEPLYRTQWVRYDGRAVATSVRNSHSPDGPGGSDDVNIWHGRYEEAWEMLSPQPSDALVAALPEDPRAALAMIRKNAVPARPAAAPRLTRAQRDFTEVVEVLAGSVTVPPDKARTIHRVLTTLEGATPPVEVTDGAGRRALALGVDGHFRDYNGERNALQVLLDPDTYAYRGVRYVAGLDYRVGGGTSHGPGPHVTKGTVVATATRVHTAVVDRPGLRS